MPHAKEGRREGGGTFWTGSVSSRLRVRHSSLPCLTRLAPGADASGWGGFSWSSDTHPRGREQKRLPTPAQMTMRLRRPDSSIGVIGDSRAESPVIRYGLSLGEGSNGQPVGPREEAMAFCLRDENDRACGSEEAPFPGVSQGVASGTTCPVGDAAGTSGVPGGGLADSLVGGAVGAESIMMSLDMAAPPPAAAPSPCPSSAAWPV